MIQFQKIPLFSPSPRPSPLKGEGDYGSGLQREREIKVKALIGGHRGILYFLLPDACR
jgi:hypothetical protein